MIAESIRVGCGDLLAVERLLSEGWDVRPGGYDDQSQSQTLLFTRTTFGDEEPPKLFDVRESISRVRRYTSYLSSPDVINDLSKSFDAPTAPAQVARGQPAASDDSSNPKQSTASNEAIIAMLNAVVDTDRSDTAKEYLKHLTRMSRVPWWPGEHQAAFTSSLCMTGPTDLATSR